MLQWGRVCEDAEMCGRRISPDARSSLQWGRVCEDAEIGLLQPGSAFSQSFNGAASVKTRKLRNPVGMVVRSFSFNGAASVKTRKWKDGRASQGTYSGLQWGRVCEDAEIWGPAGFGGKGTALQWGRVCEDAEMVTAASAVTIADYRAVFERCMSKRNQTQMNGHHIVSNYLLVKDFERHPRIRNHLAARTSNHIYSRRWCVHFSKALQV